MIGIDRSEWLALVRGTLQATLWLMAAASLGGWVAGLGVLAAIGGDTRTVMIAFGAVTVLYGVLALAVGNALGRRQGLRGITASALGALLTWGILELLLRGFEINVPALRAPLVTGVAMSVVGAAIGVSRRADREALSVQLQEELGELARDEHSGAPLLQAAIDAGSGAPADDADGAVEDDSDPGEEE